MELSSYRWIIIRGDSGYGLTDIFYGTWDELLAWGAPGQEPIAIIRGKPLTKEVKNE